MHQKQPYYPPLFTRTQTSLPLENMLEHETAEKAYEKFSEYTHHKHDNKIIITHENNAIELTKILGKGGSKLVYELTNGYAIALLNIQSNPIDIEMWNRIIKEEVSLSQELRQLGLCTQSYEESTLYFDNHPVKVLKMPTFEALAARNQQIRDIKNHHRYGTSLLFENRANLQSPAHWQEVLRGFQEDLIVYYSQNLAFGGDTFNLAVVDSAQTPDHDRTALALFTERKQKVHFCFYDFSSKHTEFKKTKYAFLNSDGNPHRESIQKEADWLFTRITSVISVGLLPIEYVNILGGIHTLLLVPGDAVIKEVEQSALRADFTHPQLLEFL